MLFQILIGLDKYMKNLIIAILIIIGMIVLWKSQEERLAQHNKYQCAVYGYEEDCKTPLPPERRLK